MLEKMRNKGCSMFLGSRKLLPSAKLFLAMVYRVFQSFMLEYQHSLLYNKSRIYEYKFMYII